MEVEQQSPFDLQSKPPPPFSFASNRDLGYQRAFESSLSSSLVVSDEQPKTLINTSSSNSNDIINGCQESTAALRLQKVYRSYRTRRTLADTAVVAEELWWNVIDSVRLNHSTISFFNFKSETASGRWNRIRLNASKELLALFNFFFKNFMGFWFFLSNLFQIKKNRVGKGLSKDEKALKLAFQHWIEAIDPRHRYGHSLHLYYEVWSKEESGQPFFYWLDIGEGREVDLEECPRSKLKQQCIKYLGPKERKHYEYIVVDGKFVHKQTGELLDTVQGTSGTKWIFVMSTSRKLYAGKKKKGAFHHSSFLAGGVTLAAGRLVVENGVLESISAYSGHYRPTDENLGSLLNFLKENGVKLNEVQVHYAEDSQNYEDAISFKRSATEVSTGTESSQLEIANEVPTDQTPEPTEVASNESAEAAQAESGSNYQRTLSGGLQSPKAEVPQTKILERINSKKAARSYQLGNQLSLKWSTGAGPRIGCIADYPAELRAQALEFTHLSPRGPATPTSFRPNAGTPRTPHPAPRPFPDNCKGEPSSIV